MPDPANQVDLAGCIAQAKRIGFRGDVLVQGVVAENGDFIDATVLSKINQELAVCLVKATALYHFKPATLDDKPIAMTINFQMGIW